MTRLFWRWRMDEFTACLALRHSKGLGARTWKRLLEAFGSAREAVAHCQEWSGRRLTSPRVEREFAAGSWRDKAEAEKKQADSLGLHRSVFWDASFPALLREIPDPPLFLYYLGDISLLTRPCVAVVGSRQSSGYGRQMAGDIAGGLGRSGLCVVSGFAHGIDRAAHLAAVDEVGGSIAVLGTGLDLIYPAANKDLWRLMSEKGLIVSEFAPGTRPEGINFPHRNRIVSGLSLGVLVVEGAVGSGSLITAELALAQNREVFALPGPATMKTFQGCHQLIRQGACLVQSADDIVRELQPRLGLFVRPAAASRTDRPEPADPDQRVVYAILRDQGQIHVDVLARQTGWPAEKVSATLLFMELEGLARQLPGMFYELAT